VKLKHLMLNKKIFIPKKRVRFMDKKVIYISLIILVILIPQNKIDNLIELDEVKGIEEVLNRRDFYSEI